MFCQMVKSLIVGLALQRELRVYISIKDYRTTFDFMLCQMVKSLIVGLALQRKLRGLYIHKGLKNYL
jgi:hypothetical protein